MENCEIEILRKKNAKFSNIFEVIKIISSQRNLDDLLASIIKETTGILEADRTSLFIYDERKDELWSKIAEKAGVKEIRFSAGKGIAGHVVKTGKPIVIKEAYECDLFNPEIDRITGFKTKNILCAPMVSVNKKLIGVIEVMNKKSGAFTAEDEDIIEMLCSLVAVLIENAILTEQNLKRERMAAIGNMAGTIIHDLKNPMTTIKGYAELIAIKAPDVTKYSNIITGEIDRLSNMTHELLEFARGIDEQLRFEKVNCADFFTGIFSFLERDFDKNEIELTYSIKYSGEIEINADKIKRVIFNISCNAQEAMENCGRFNVNINETDDKKNVKISLEDSGKGIPAEIKDRIFESFVTHGKKRGTGLGLAITKKIIDAHRGNVNVESEEGKGSRFEIILPKEQT